MRPFNLKKNLPVRGISEVTTELRQLLNSAPASFRESYVPWAPSVPQEACKEARLFGNRREMLASLVSPGTEVIEVGTQTGKWARVILDDIKPAKLHVVDIDWSQFDNQLFQKHEPIVIHDGKSWEILETFPNNHFDLIYIDASHEENHVRLDANVSIRKIKQDGILIFNDYTTWSPYEVAPYGVLKVVNEILVSGEWKIAGFALHPWGFHDIALIRK